MAGRSRPGSKVGKRKVLALPPGRAAPPKARTLDARFTRLLELRGDAAHRQAGARQQLLAKKRGQKPPPPAAAVKARAALLFAADTLLYIRLV